MSIPVYQVLHVTSIILVIAIAFQSCADPDESKKKTRMMLGGVFGALALIAGFGLLSKLKLEFEGWVIVKLFCWAGIAALSGIAYRKSEKASVLSLIAAALVVVAVYCVYYRPF